MVLLIGRLDLNEVKNRTPITEVRLRAPVETPDKVVCVGMNYKDHCEEQGAPIPAEPLFFSKFASNIIGPFDPIRYPNVTKVSSFYNRCLIFLPIGYE